ncbi:MAG: hypothetical protein Q8O91_05620 [Candidatus Aminicenantes bacterium]|nr:hypothetical protein [Candidatus Aminicenantes bacterium]
MELMGFLGLLELIEEPSIVPIIPIVPIISLIHVWDEWRLSAKTAPGKSALEPSSSSQDLRASVGYLVRFFSLVNRLCVDFSAVSLCAMKLYL